MAIYPDSQIDLQVESSSTAKSAYLLSENITINLTLKNITDSRITVMKMCLLIPLVDLDPSYTGYSLYLIDIKTNSSLSWAKDTSKDFSFTFNPAKLIKSYDASNTTTIYQSMINQLNESRSLPIRISAWIGNNDYPALNYTIPNVTYINKRYLRSIKFNLDRSPTDESTTLAATIKVTFTGDAGNYKNDFTAKLYYAQGNDVSESSTEKAMAFDYDTLFGTGYTNNTTVVTGDFVISNNYSFLLVVSDGKEKMTAKTVVSRAFANVHFSGQPTGGVAFGRFSTSLLNHPKFECEYPAYFYSGIADIGMETGEIVVANDVTTPDSGNNGNGVLRISKFCGIVFLSGGIRTAPATTSKLIATIPDGFRPSGSISKLVTCDGSRYGRIRITADGSLYLDWVYMITNASKYTSELWIDCNMIYML